MSNIIDKRSVHNSQSPSKDKFFKRARNAIRNKLKELVSTKKSISDETGTEDVQIESSKTLDEEIITNSAPPSKRIIHSNDKYIRGSEIPIQSSNSQSGSNGDEGELNPESYELFISRSEINKLLYDGLELPNLDKKHKGSITSTSLRRAGYRKEGPICDLSIKETMKLAKMRKIATKSNRFIDPIDMRYRNKALYSKPITQAVMFCIMDVSGSMDKNRRDMAKTIFYHTYNFLKIHYPKIKVEFIAHTTAAEYLTEQDFFNNTYAGGTLYTPALRLLEEAIHGKYNHNNYCIYCVHCSDGDIGRADSAAAAEYLKENILPYVKLMAYVETEPSHLSAGWYREYIYDVNSNKVKSLACVTDGDTIYDAAYSVFRSIFLSRDKKRIP